MQLRQQITGHFIYHWGVPAQIHVQRDDLAVLEFAPQGNRKTFRFATNGMSRSIQPSGDLCYRTEVYVCANSPAPWMIDLLKSTAEYPEQHRTHFLEGNTIPVKFPLPSTDFPFQALLIAPPEPSDPPTIGAICDSSSGETIFIHQLIGITQNELAYAMLKGSERLLHRLVSLGEPLLIDKARQEAV
ncbi:MAG: suppressor of fused domain protein [Armatimonadetes bacterium]|nr:suppressor of fused domain protein [Armatimonadota bacterium]